MKKVLSFFICITVLFTLAIPMSAVASMLGDLNGDQKVNVTDAMILKSYLLHKSTKIDTDAADINKDGQVDGADYLLLKNLITGESDAGELKPSTWLWTTTEIKTKADDWLDFMYINKVSVLYLQVDYSISTQDYQTFISKCTSKGIKVYATGGGSDWTTGAAVRTEFFTWLEEYQNASDAAKKFSGINLDIEPYSLDGWKTTDSAIHAATVLEYQNAIVDCVDRARSLGLPASFCIPFWFDGEKCEDFKDPKKPTETNLARWILSKVDEIVIMAYRDTASSIAAISCTEVGYADSLGKKVTVAVETKQQALTYTSFYEEGKKYMYEQLEQVNNTYKSHASYKGCAIHYIASWNALSWN